MAEGSAKTVRSWFDRLQAGDPAPELCDPGIVIRNWSESPVPGPYEGHEGLRRWWRAVTDPDMGVDMQMFELEELIELDDERCLVLLRATGRGRASGFEVDQRWGGIITVRNGLIVAARGYADRGSAREAAGLTG
jgi:ketosteroid isomerase-like protein